MLILNDHKAYIVEQALKRFNRGTLDIIKEVRERSFYRKPSSIKKELRKQRALQIKIANRRRKK